MTQQQQMPDREKKDPQRPDQGQQWDPNKQGGKDPGQERFPGQEQERRNPGQPGIPSGQ